MSRKGDKQFIKTQRRHRVNVKAPSSQRTRLLNKIYSSIWASPDTGSFNWLYFKRSTSDCWQAALRTPFLLLLTGSSTTLLPCPAASFTSLRALLRLSALTLLTCSWTTARRNSEETRTRSFSEQQQRATQSRRLRSRLQNFNRETRTALYLLDMTLAKVDMYTQDYLHTPPRHSPGHVIPGGGLVFKIRDLLDST